MIRGYVNQIDLDRWFKRLPLKVIYKDDVRVLIHYRRAVDGYSIVIKEERVAPRRYTMYVYHMFITFDFVLVHAHFKYKVETPIRWWLNLKVGERLSLEKLFKLLRGET